MNQLPQDSLLKQIDEQSKKDQSESSSFEYVSISDSNASSNTVSLIQQQQQYSNILELSAGQSNKTNKLDSFNPIIVEKSEQSCQLTQISYLSDKDGISVYESILKQINQQENQVQSLQTIEIGSQSIQLVNRIEQDFDLQEINNISLTQSFQQIFAKNEELEQDLQQSLENFQIREYQKQLYYQGRGLNSIIYLETGTGKTLILMMLMLHQMCKNQKKKAIFLANQTLLVEQQASQFRSKLKRVASLLADEYNDIEGYQTYIDDVTNSIRTIHGQKFSDFYSGKRWDIILSSTRLFFMTPQYFLNCLRRGLLKMSDFSVIAFDECHATEGNHQYNSIMQEFYLPNKYEPYQNYNNFVPVIIGSTGSPVFSHTKEDYQSIKQDVLKLCSNLDSKIIYLDKDKFDLKLNESNLNFLRYPLPLNSRYIYEYLEYNEKDESMLNQLIRTNANAFDELLIVYAMVKQTMLVQQIKYVEQLKDEIFRFLIKTGFIILNEIGYSAYLRMIYIVQEALERAQRLAFQREVADFCRSFPRLDEVIVRLQQRIYNSPTLGYSEKFLTLLDYFETKIFQEELIQENVNENEKNLCLIFVNNRILSQMLSEEINSYMVQNNREHIKADFIVGQSKGTGARVKQIIQSVNVEDRSDDKTLQKIQFELDLKNFTEIKKERIIRTNHLKLTQHENLQIEERAERFRQKLTRILVSTSVAEEGVDIPECNFVFCWNQVHSSRQFIQIKGRARKEDSNLVVMIPEQTIHQIYGPPKINMKPYYNDLQSKIKQSVQQVIELGDKLYQSNRQIQRKSSQQNFYEKFRIDYSGALINTKWAYQHLSDICISIPVEKTNYKPRIAIYVIKDTFYPQYLSFVLLPHFFQTQIFKGSVTQSIEQSKQSAALRALIKLHNDGYLTGDLQSRYATVYGFKMGLGEDDLNIIKSARYQLVTSQYTKTLNLEILIRGIKIDLQKTYYQINNKKLLEIQNPTKIIQVEIKINNQRYSLVADDVLLKFLNQSQIQMDHFSFQIVLETQKDLDQLDHEQLKSKFQEQLFQQHKFKKDLDLFIEEKTNLVYLNSNDQNILFIPLEQDGQIIVAYKTLLAIIKSKLLYQQIKDSWSLYDPTKISINRSFIYNQIIDQYWKQSYEANQIYVGSQVDMASSDLRDKYFSHLQEAICFCLDTSKNNTHHDKILIGKAIYKFFVSLQFYIQKLNFDRHIMSRSSRGIMSDTYVKINLIAETKIHQYLGRLDDQTLSLYIPTLRIINNQVNDQVENMTNEERKLEFQTKNPMHIEFSTSQITNFFFSMIGQLSIFDDEHFNLSLDLILNLKVFTQSTFRHYPLNVIQFIKELSNHYQSRKDFQTPQSYQQLERALGYKFQRNVLLFQALVDPSAKDLLLQKQLPTFKSVFDKQQEKTAEQTYIESFYQQILGIQAYKQIEYSNSHLAYLGKHVHRILYSQILQRFEDYDMFETARKLIKDVRLLSLIALDLEFDKLLLCSNYIKPGMRQLRQVYSERGYTLIPDINYDNTIFTLCETFRAIIGALFIEMNGDLKRLQRWFESFMLTKYGWAISDFNIKNDEHYKFLKWYRIQFPEKDPKDFNLIKIPHQNKNKKTDYLYIPYDKKENSIVNLIQADLENIEQLHFYSKTKYRAYRKIYQVIFKRVY